MVLVKAGTFMMGCTAEQYDCRENEQPAHAVSVSDFYISRYELTQDIWKALMGNHQSHFEECSRCPVNKVNWYKVNAFIDMLNARSGKKYRLPTEAEWEYAARGGHQSKDYIYAGGNDAQELAVHHVAGTFQQSKEVGTKKPNELGLYDMSGNVYEWCSDWYRRDYYEHSPVASPTGPKEGTSKCIRGGSSIRRAVDNRVSSRQDYLVDGQHGTIGFRLAADLE